jgi:hypothetical protein
VKGAITAVAIFVALLALPAVAAAATSTVTLGPQLPASSGISEGCAFEHADCADLQTALDSGLLVQAPSNGTITTWRVDGFQGTAQLLIVQADMGGTYTVLRRSAAETEPCIESGDFCGPFGGFYAFTTSLQIAAGQYIGIELESPANCNDSPDDDTCADIGYTAGSEANPISGTYQYFDPTPADNAPTAPEGIGGDGQPAQGELLYDADEVTKTVSVSLSPAKITADGQATATATATVQAGGNPVKGDAIAFTSSDGDVKIGPVADHGDGTYTATITSSHTVGGATITATDTSEDPGETGTATLTEAAPTISVKVSPSKIVADGKSTATATVTLKGVLGEPVSGEDVTVNTTGPALAGLVKDAGNGTYTATVTATHAGGAVTITAADDSVSPSVSATAKLTTTPVQCIVPKLAGATLAAAKASLGEANCSAGKLTTKSSTKVAKGKIISSSPKAGTKLTFGAPVALTESSGKPKQCIVPALAGKALAAAKKALSAAHCSVGTVKSAKSSKVAKGKIISSSPKAGTKHKEGTKVALVESKGKK